MGDKKENFTSFETEVLAGLIDKYKAIINNKVTNSVSNKAKDRCWVILTQEYNSINGVKPRTDKQLRSKFKNMKKLAQQRKANDKVSVFATGGGPSVILSTPIDQQLSAMGVVTDPTPCFLDCDGVYEHMIRNRAEESVSVSSQEEEFIVDSQSSSTPRVRMETLFPESLQAVEVFQAPDTPQPVASTPSRNRVPLTRPEGTGTPITLEDEGDRVPLIRTKRRRPNVSEKAVETLTRSAEKRDAALAEEMENRKRESELKCKLMEEEQGFKNAIHKATLKAEEDRATAERERATAERERAAAAIAKRRYYENLSANNAQRPV